MTKDECLKSPAFKILLPLCIFTIIFLLWQNGYEFGQWLYRILHAE